MSNGETSRSSRLWPALILLLSLGVLTYIFWGQWDALAIVAGGGLIVVGALLLVFKTILRIRDSRRDTGLREAFGAPRKPRELNNPEDIAKLSDLEGKFQEGINTYKAAGKNLYSLPWYVLVGEPGSGKTEMLRHSGVPSPLGELPGVGGTINMNWWFTNQAVVLDTAGRIMFQQVEAGKTTEWKAFLELLKKARGNCPINGLLLCIPAESLIRDTIDKVEDKAKKIAKQFDTIQRTLDIRFPVFVVITKADLVNGFRSFFDQMDPGEQQQILGWSNPSRNLDERFDPDQIDRHLATVRERLLRRRMALLIDPVHTEDPSARRADQVDDLYAFPDALMTIAPRLRRYLETIFVVGEWSPKPLFLRGLYFTSSMRQGASLDTELAYALGVPVDSLPEGRVWDEARAYFLRDLFLRKVFPEKGLVTRNTKAQGLYRRRKATVLAAGFIAVVALLGLTIYGQRQLDQAILSHQGFWSRVAGTYIGEPKAWPRALMDVEQTDPATQMKRHAYAYGGQKAAYADDPKNSPTVRQFHEKAVGEIAADIEVPLIFRPVAGLQPNLASTERREAYRRIVDQTILVPVVKAAREKILRKDSAGAAVDLNAVAALRQLIRIEVQGDPASASGGAAAEPLQLDPLFRYVLSDEEYQKYWADHDALQAAVASVYGAGSPAGSGRLPAELISDPDAAKAIEAGVSNFIKAAIASTGDENLNTRQGDLTEFVTTLRKFRDYEAAMQGTAAAMPPAPKDVPAYVELTKSWKARIQEVASRAKAIDAQMARVRARPGGWPPGKPLLALYVDERRASIGAARTAFKELEAEIPPTAAKLQAQRKSLIDRVKDVPSSESPPIDESLKHDFNELEAQYLWAGAEGGGADTALYNIYLKGYQKVTDRLPDLTAAAPPPTALQVPKIGDRLDAIANGVKTMGTEISATFPKQVDKKFTDPVLATCTDIEQKLTAPAMRYQVVLRVLAKVPQTKEAFAQWVADESKAQGSRSLPALPMTSIGAGGKPLAIDPQYDKAGAAKVLADAGALARRIGQMAPSGATASAAPSGAAAAAAPMELAVDAAGLLTIYNQIRTASIDPYATDYVKYWRGILAATQTVTAADWAAYQAQLPKTSEEANKALGEIINAANDALSAVADAAIPADKQAIQQELQRMSAAAAALKVQGGLVQTDSLVTRSDRALLKWQALGTKQPAAAVDAIEQEGILSFYSNYLIWPAGDIATDYWAKVTRRGFDLLKDQRKVAPLKQVAELLTKYSRFPAAPPQAGAQPMTKAEVKAANADMDDVAARLMRAQKATQDLTVRPIKDQAFVNEFMATFYPAAPTAADQKKFDKARLLIDACAADNHTVTVVNVDRVTQKALARQVYGTEATIQTDQIAVVRPVVPNATGALAYPTNNAGAQIAAIDLDEKGDAKFEMTATPISKDALPQKVGSVAPWAGVRILHELRALPAPTDREKKETPGQAVNWYVELPLRDYPRRGETTAIWVQMVFPKGLPMELK